MTDDTDSTTHTSRSHGEPTTAIVQTVAAATDRDPLTLPPLHEHVDTDALNTLLASAPEDARLRVRFRYDSVTVVVHADGRIDVATDDD